MAARKKNFHDEGTRQKIQSAMLINRLTNHITTNGTDKDFQKKYMDRSQVSAALGLLNKVLPDLSKTELSGNADAPLGFSFTVNHVKPKDV